MLLLGEVLGVGLQTSKLDSQRTLLDSQRTLRQNSHHFPINSLKLNRSRSANANLASHQGEPTQRAALARPMNRPPVAHPGQPRPPSYSGLPENGFGYDALPRADMYAGTKSGRAGWLRRGAMQNPATSTPRTRTSAAEALRGGSGGPKRMPKWFD